MNQASTTVSVKQPEALHAVLIEELSDFGKILHHDDKRLIVEVDTGVIDNLIVDQSMQVTISSDSPANLHMLREAVNHFTEEHMQLPPLTWSDEQEIEVGALPPNCRVATVIDAQWFSNSFIRITLHAERLESYTNIGLHFRIGIPPVDRTPVWPHLSPKGKTIWPQGVDKLHTPAYTTVTVTPESNELTFDVYAHNHGETCAWATGLAEGTDLRKEIILSGPGGNWMPPTQQLIIAGDETALPAIRRTLETATPDDNIFAFVEMATRQDFELATESINHQITMLPRSEGLSAKAALLALDEDTVKDSYIWFAGEKSDARELRTIASESWNVPRGQTYIAAYWSRNKSANQ